MLNMEAVSHFLSTQGADFALKIVSALAAWIIGRWLISLVVRGFGIALDRGRKVDATLANGVDPLDAIARLKAAVAAIPNMAKAPAPDVEILQFTPEGPLLCVRPHTHTDHCWQVYFDTHKAVVATFGAADYPTPETPIAPRNR